MSKTGTKLAGASGAEAVAAIGGKIHECFLQGVLAGGRAHATLVERLRGLCELPEEQVLYREYVYRALALSTAEESTPQQHELRVRCTLQGEPRWTLHFLGTPQTRAGLTTNVRNVIEVEVSDNICAFLGLMGYHNTFDFIRDGLLFTTSKKITVTVTNIKKHLADRPQSKPLTESLDDTAFLVEVSALTADQGIQHTMEEVVTFVEHLIPLVQLKKFDYRVLAKSASAMPSPQTKNSTTPKEKRKKKTNTNVQTKKGTSPPANSSIRRT
ncbi:hypothetical protein QOT17_001781 [Balamuthia mandrillaris]